MVMFPESKWWATYTSADAWEVEVDPKAMLAGCSRIVAAVRHRSWLGGARVLY